MARVDLGRPSDVTRSASPLSRKNQYTERLEQVFQHGHDLYQGPLREIAPAAIWIVLPDYNQVGAPTVRGERFSR